MLLFGLLRISMSHLSMLPCMLSDSQIMLCLLCITFDSKDNHIDHIGTNYISACTN